MKKKSLSCVLVASLFFSIGCYSTRAITKEELEAEKEPIDIIVCTKDSLEYKFSEGYYRIQGDMLLGWSRVLTVPSSTFLSFQERVALLESGHPVSTNTYTRDSVVTSIALADITSLETKEFNGLATTAVIALSVPVLYYLVAIIAVLSNPGK